MKLRVWMGVLALVMLSEGGQAQPIAGGEMLRSYHAVRGWVVDRVHNPARGFTGCRAQQEGIAETFVLDRIDGAWRMITTGFADGAVAGGVIDIDGRRQDVQFAVAPGLVVYALSAADIARLKSGSRMRIDVTGDPAGARSYALRGTVAAFLKVEECADRGGRAAPGRADTAQPVPATLVPEPAPESAPEPELADPAILYAVPFGESEAGDCETPSAGLFRCLLDGLPAKAGYAFSNRVYDAFGGGVIYDLDVRDNRGADVWVDAGQGWRFMGFWEVTEGGTCLTPDANPTAEVRANRGADAWGLCIR